MSTYEDPDLVIQEECKKATNIMYIIGVIVIGNYYCAIVPKSYTHSCNFHSRLWRIRCFVRRESFSLPQCVEEYRRRLIPLGLRTDVCPCSEIQAARNDEETGVLRVPRPVKP